MRFAVVRAAAYRCRNAWRFDRIEKIRVERCMKAVGAFRGNGQRLVQNRSYSAPIDFFHREDTDTGLLDHFPFLRINVTDTDHYGMRRLNLGRKIEDMCQ